METLTHSGEQRRSIFPKQQEGKLFNLSSPPQAEDRVPLGLCLLARLFSVTFSTKTVSMTAKEILSQLKEMGTESTRRILEKHGAPPNQYGVKVEDLKKIQKKVKKDYTLSLELYDTGNSDAQYLAGLIADETKMTRKDLQHWAETASWHQLNEYTVAWIAAESDHGWELGLKWIDSKKENVQSSGWATLANLVALKNDEDLDLKELRKLLQKAQNEIMSAPARVSYTMNAFIISVGGYVKELTAEALKIGKALGAISVDMHGTACKVPFAPDYIQKMVARGYKKKKMARC
jgi:3-methyladenine DNA glycosylase AlkD